MKQECEIVKDLLPSYVEELVSEETKKFVVKHVAKCSDCRKILEDMREDKKIEKEQDLKEDEAVAKQIKKYKRKMQILKISIIALLSIFILTFIIGCFIYLPRYSIISKAYNKIQEVSNTENYKYTRNSYQFYYDTQEKYEYLSIFYYKDGNFKEETSYNSLKEKIYYGNINSDKTISIDSNTNKTSEINTYHNKDELFDCFYRITDHKHYIFSLGRINIRTDYYNGKECYVFKYGNSTTRYTEIWIDKETMFQVREINQSENIYYEDTYIIECNVVTDEDVQMPELSEYMNQNQL